MHGEADVLLPVGQPRLGKKDRDNRHFQPDDFDGAPPREKEGPAKHGTRFRVHDGRAKNPQDGDKHVTNELSEFAHREIYCGEAVPENENRRELRRMPCAELSEIGPSSSSATPHHSAYGTMTGPLIHILAKSRMPRRNPR